MDTVNLSQAPSPAQQQIPGATQSRPKTALTPQQQQLVGTVALSRPKVKESNTPASTSTTQSSLSKDDDQKVSDAVKDINSFFQMAERSLEFNVDKTSGRVVMQIVDTNTHELISQIPGEDVIKLAKRLDEVTGLLFKAQA